MSRSLAGFLHSLRQAGLDIDAEAALDSLWLGLQMQARRRDVPSATEPADGGPSGRSALTPDERRRGDTREPAVDRSKTRERLASERATQRARAEIPRADVAASGRVLTLSRAAALPESRELVKALRPLRRRVVSPGPGTLDLNTTVRRAAEEDLWIPSFASTRERWLDVLLVADHGLSMILWKDTIDEFERVLATSGAFRSVRSWWLESDAAQPAIAARGRGPSPATPERLARLTRGIGRSVVVIVSDCVGARWYDGTIPALMAHWARVLPVALTQVTPEWFWARTALGDTVGSEFRSTIPAAMNHRFRWDSRALGAGVLSPEEEKTLFRVPAVTLTAAAVARLSGLIAGVGRDWAPGVVFDLAWRREEEQTSRLSVTADERVARFTALASKEAKRLAAAFAACPVLTLGVLRLLRRDLVPEAGPFVEAEVLLGGITRVRREQARWDLGASLPLEFVPGVQSRLLDGALAGDVLRVLAHAAAIAETGVGPTFSAWLDNPSSAAAKLDPAESPFAAAAAHVLERLGGTYAQMVTTRSRPVEDVPPEPDAGQSSREFNGWPHELPVPDVLVGRAPIMERLKGWLEENPSRMPTLIGAAGIGKSTIAGRLIRRWVARHPPGTVFSWCFQRDPSSGEALRALQYVAAGNDLRKNDVGLDEATKNPLDPTEPRFIVLDGLDGITDPAELSQVLSTAESVMSARRTHILLTTREPLPETRSPMLVDIGPLDDASVEELVSQLLSTAHAGAFDGDAVGLVRRLSGGYPLLVEFVVERARRLTPQGLFEEFGFLYREGDSIDPRGLSSVAETLDRAERARALADEARSLLSTDAAKAVEAFGEVVELRRALPSIAGKAQALFEYGDASLRVARYQEAGSSLEEALEIYRSVSDHREIITTLDRLSEARLALGRLAETLSLLEEALALRRRLNEPEEIYNGLLRLATAEAGQQRWREALAHYQEATHVGPADVSPADLGSAHLGAARAYQAIGDLVAALSSVQEAVRLFEAGEDRTSLVSALDLVAQLQEGAGDYNAARRTLNRLKQVRIIKVYLSSALTDLEAERAAVKEVLSGAGTVIASEEFGATAEGPLDTALRRLAECDVYVLVLGLRYGYVPPGETRSITHLEYDAATARGLPRLVFIKTAASTPFDQIDAMTQDQPSRIDAFRKEVSSGAAGAPLPAVFTTLEELKMQVLQAFTDFRFRRAEADADRDIDQRLLHLASMDASEARQSPAQTVTPEGDVLQGDDAVVSVEFLISGRVQAVGFRQFAQAAARELGLEGHVENLPDGRIRVHATGPRARLKQLQERLRQGPRGARVEQVSTTILEDESPAAAIDGADSSTRALLAIGIGSTGTLPRLPAAVDAARRVAEWADSQGIARDLIWLLTDDSGPVTPTDIVDIVRSAVERGTLRQLIVYFAGYAVGINRSETWLLSRAPEDPRAAVNLEESVALARHAGIPHIVFVSDSCRVVPESIAAQRVTGTLLFPHQPDGQTRAAIDRFAADVVGPPARDVKDVNEAARRYSALYTSVLLSALSGVEPDVLDERDGVTFVRPDTLRRYLHTAIDERQRERGVAIGAQQRPAAIIESDRDAWIARFPAPRPTPLA